MAFKRSGVRFPSSPKYCPCVEPVTIRKKIFEPEIVILRDILGEHPSLGIEAKSKLLHTAPLRFVDPFWHHNHSKRDVSTIDQIEIFLKNETISFRSNTFVLAQGLTGKLFLESLNSSMPSMAGFIWINPILQINKGRFLIFLSRVLPAILSIWKGFYLSKVATSANGTSLKNRVLSKFLYLFSKDNTSLSFDQFQFPVLLLCSDKHVFQSSRVSENLNQEFYASELTRFVHLGYDILNENPSLSCKYIDEFILKHSYTKRSKDKKVVF